MSQLEFVQRGQVQACRVPAQHVFYGDFCVKALSFLIVSFLVRSGSPFPRPDPHGYGAGARRSGQGWARRQRPPFSSAGSFFNGWRSTPGTINEWLGSNGVSERLRSLSGFFCFFGLRIDGLHRQG